MDVAIPNLDFIRQLIADARQDVPAMDVEASACCRALVWGPTASRHNRGIDNVADFPKRLAHRKHAAKASCRQH